MNRTSILAILLLVLTALVLPLIIAQAKPTDGKQVNASLSARIPADQAYSEVIGWSMGLNDATSRAKNSGQISGIYESVELAAYRYGVIPEFALAVLTVEAYFAPQISHARGESWALYEQHTNYKMKKYPGALVDLDTALSSLAVIMQSAQTRDEVLTRYWSGPGKKVNADTLPTFIECVNKIYGGLQPYANARKEAERQGRVKPNSYEEIFDDYSGWSEPTKYARGDMDGYSSRLRMLKAHELKVWPSDEKAYAAKVKGFNKKISDADALLIARAILTYCSQTNFEVDPRLVMALVAAESAFRPQAVSHVGAMGLGQLMPSTAKSLGVSRPFDPVQNLYGCVRYIEREQHRWRNSKGDRVSLILAAYNAGPGAVQKYKGVPPYRETQNYVKTVKKYYNQFIR